MMFYPVLLQIFCLIGFNRGRERGGPRSSQDLEACQVVTVWAFENPGLKLGPLCELCSNDTGKRKDTQFLDRSLFLTSHQSNIPEHTFNCRHCQLIVNRLVDIHRELVVGYP
jgi:hypothetical protein